MPSWGYRIFVPKELPHYISHCTHPKCNQIVKYQMEFQYVTGRAGRTATRDAYLCEKHAATHAKKQKIEVPPPPTQAIPRRPRPAPYSSPSTPPIQPKDCIITPDVANRIYDVLEQHCHTCMQAKDRKAFVDFVSTVRNGACSDGEYRLGDEGLKFYFNRYGWEINWYMEFLTPDRRETCQKVKMLLEAIRSSL